MWASNNSSDLTPRLGTSISHRSGPKNTKAMKVYTITGLTYSMCTIFKRAENKSLVFWVRARRTLREDVTSNRKYLRTNRCVRTKCQYQSVTFLILAHYYSRLDNSFSTHYQELEAYFRCNCATGNTNNQIPTFLVFLLLFVWLVGLFCFSGLYVHLTSLKAVLKDAPKSLGYRLR